MKLVFVDTYKKDKVIATVQSDIIPTSSRGASMDVILKGKKYTTDNVTIDYDNKSVIIEVI
jgi:hypothetical protein